MGQPWDDSETLQLLKEIQEKQAISEIAKGHERTEGGIASRLRTLAWEYHSEGRSLEEIMKFTGLRKSAIQRVIKKYSPVVEDKNVKEDSEILAVLKDIQSMMKELVENTRTPKRFIVKK